MTATMTEVFDNAVSPGTTTFLLQPLGAADTTLEVTGPSSPSLQGGEFRVLVYDPDTQRLEFMMVTGGQNTAQWEVQRGIENTTPIDFPANSIVKHVFTTGSMEAILANTITPAQADARYVIAFPGGNEVFSGNTNIPSTTSPKPYIANTGAIFQSINGADPGTQFNGHALSPIRPVGISTASTFSDDSSGTTWQFMSAITSTGNRQAIAAGFLAWGQHVWGLNPNVYSISTGGVAYGAEIDVGYTGPTHASVTGLLISALKGMGTKIATALDKTVQITHIDVDPLPDGCILSAGAIISVNAYGLKGQQFTLTDPANPGDVILKVGVKYPLENYPVGTAVNIGNNTGDAIRVSAEINSPFANCFHVEAPTSGLHAQPIDSATGDMFLVDHNVSVLNGFNLGGNYANAGLLFSGIYQDALDFTGKFTDAAINFQSIQAGTVIKMGDGNHISFGNGDVHWPQKGGQIATDHTQYMGFWGTNGVQRPDLGTLTVPYGGVLAKLIGAVGNINIYQTNNAGGSIDAVTTTMHAVGILPTNLLPLQFQWDDGSAEVATMTAFVGGIATITRGSGATSHTDGVVLLGRSSGLLGSGSGLVKSDGIQVFKQITPVIANQNVTIPPGTFEIEMIAGGGGGGNGAAATSAIAQVSGSAGGAGEYSKFVYTNPGPTNQTATVNLGAGGNATGPGGDTTVVINGVTYTARGGGHGLNAAGNSTTAVGGGTYGGAQANTSGSTNAPGPGAGGASSTSNSASNAGGHVGLSGTGGQAGTAATTGGLGGKGGLAGVVAGIAAPSVNSGNTANTSGTNGADAAANSGAGGGGGGAAATGGTPGTGGKGGSGCVWIKQIHY